MNEHPSPTTRHIPTPHGTLALHSAPAGTPSPPSTAPAILLIHGNSSSSAVFRTILTSPLTATHPVLALDLPGHGASSNAPDPAASYTQSSYAGAALDVLVAADIRSVVLLGWSLGGHVALEMIPRAGARGVRIAGAMLVGTPPIPRGGVRDGFRVEGDGRSLASFREVLSEAEMEALARAATDAPYEAWMLEGVRRTDGRARRVMFEAMAVGRDSDQRAIAEGAKDVPIAIVNGKEEPFIKIEYIRTVQFANLWRSECFELDGLHHAPFWEDWDRFKPYLYEFVEDCSKG